MPQQLIINTDQQGGYRIALLDERTHRLEDVYLEPQPHRSLVGNIYKGVIANVIPSLQSAFIDIGLNKNAFLFISEVRREVPFSSGGLPREKARSAPLSDTTPLDPPQTHPFSPDSPFLSEETPFPRQMDQGGAISSFSPLRVPASRPLQKNSFSPRPFRRRPSMPAIQDLLHPGQECLVQVSRDPIGDKGPSVTEHITLPAHSLILMPMTPGHIGISRRIIDPQRREFLRTQLLSLRPPRQYSYILRTGIETLTKMDLRRDLSFLLRLWHTVEERLQSSPPRSLIYQESSLIVRALREMISPSLGEIIVDQQEPYQRVCETLSQMFPRSKIRVYHYKGATPIFYKFRIEEKIQELHHRKVQLPSGGSLLIEPTEALITIDVNTGHHAGNMSQEEANFRTNLEAAMEIPHQLKLRDLGGLIIIDFIDLKDPRHWREVESKIRQELRKDRSKTVVLPMSRFGILQLTREKTGQGIGYFTLEKCPACQGRGWVKNIDALTSDLFRQIQWELSQNPERRSVEVRVHPRVLEAIHNVKREYLADFERRMNCYVNLSQDPAQLALDEFSMLCQEGRSEKEPV